MASDTVAKIKVCKKVISYCCETVKPADSEKNLILEFEKRCRDDKCLPQTMHVFNDSIHGTIEVNSLESAIIDSPEFSRLKDIKQLGGKYHVFHGATHTRFQHSIGVCHLAGELVQHLKRQEMTRREVDDAAKISDKEELCLRLAGLCHDLGHGPFSHIFESVTKEVLEEDDLHHEKLSLLLFKKILLDNPKVLHKFVWCYDLTTEHVKMIEEMIAPDQDSKEKKEKKCFLYEIIANKESGMDVDKWDYFARDFLHLGVTYEFDWRRCMKMSSIVEVDGNYHIGFRDKEVTNIYGMFRTRSILYFKALGHTTVEAVELMLKDILVKSQSVKFNTTVHGKSCSLKEALEQAYKKTPADLTGYIALTDSLLHLIRHSYNPPTERVVEEVKEAQTLIDRLREREIYKMEKLSEKTLDFLDGDDVPGHEDELKRKEIMIKGVIKRYNEQFLPKDSCEIKLVCFKLSSEQKYLNPLDAMYFFQKQDGASLKEVPTGLKESDELIQAASPVCKPEKFIEYRIRLYVKVQNAREEEKEKMRKNFDDCYKELPEMLVMTEN